MTFFVASIHTFLLLFIYIYKVLFSVCLKGFESWFNCYIIDDCKTQCKTNETELYDWYSVVIDVWFYMLQYHLKLESTLHLSIYYIDLYTHVWFYDKIYVNIALIIG